MIKFIIFAPIKQNIPVMKIKNYMPRISDGLLSKKLRHSGAVLITGPKWCGKTATASVASNSIVYMQDPDRGAAYLTAADTKPSILLQGDVPHLIDEWQMAPVPNGCLKD